jgi:hypothetical protein
MVNGEALQLALVLHAQPTRSAEFRVRALPAGVTEVLRIASGNAASVASAAEQNTVPAETLVDAARFYVEQQLLARECEHDPWRVLGVPPAAEPDLIRDHRRLLMGLVHPDRGQDWAAAFSDRVNRAWRELKTPEGRLAAARQPVEPVPDHSWRTEPADTSFRDTTEDHPNERVGGDSDDAWAPVVGQQSRSADDAGNVQWPVSSVPSSVHANPPPRSASRAATLGGVALLLSGVALLGWNLIETDGLGDEVLVPMADVARPVAAPQRNPQISQPMTPLASADSIDQHAVPSAPSDAAIIASMLTLDADAAAADQVVSTATEVQPPVGLSSGSNNVIPAQAGIQENQSTGHRSSPVRRNSGGSLAVRSDSSGAVASSASVGPQTPTLAAATPRTPAPARTERSQMRKQQVPPTKQVDSVAAAASPVNSMAPSPTDAATSGSGRNRTGLQPAAPAASESTQQEGSGPEAVALAAAPSPPSSSHSDRPGDTAMIQRQASTPAYRSDLSSAQAAGVLHSFSQHYSTGDLSALVGLFSSEANSARGGSMALAADYARLFESTSEREFAVRDLRWRIEGDTLRGEGRFEARYYRKGRLFRQVVKGEISFVMVAENGDARILRLDSRPDGSGA